MTSKAVDPFVLEGDPSVEWHAMEYTGFGVVGHFWRCNVPGGSLLIDREITTLLESAELVQVRWSEESMPRYLCDPHDPV